MQPWKATWTSIGRHIQEGAERSDMAQHWSDAPGPAPFNATAVTFADSLDDLMAVSNKMFADPKTMQIMTDSGAQILGRVIGRNMCSEVTTNMTYAQIMEFDMDSAVSVVELMENMRDEGKGVSPMPAELLVGADRNRPPGKIIQIVFFNSVKEEAELNNDLEHTNYKPFCSRILGESWRCPPHRPRRSRRCHLSEQHLYPLE